MKAEEPRGWDLRLLGVAGLALAVVEAGELLTPVLLWAEEEITITATGLQPPVLRTAPERRVTFVNRTGQLVHVDFGEKPGQHHTFQVPGQIWAIFHRPGRHVYEVHFPDGRAVSGAVDVVEDPYERPGPPTFSGVTVMGECLER